MSWRTHDYQCESCAHSWIEMLKRDEEPLPMKCPECGGVGIRIFGAPMVMNASLRDGNGRFAHLKEQRRLVKAAAEQKARGNFAEVDRINKEKGKIR